MNYVQTRITPSKASKAACNYEKNIWKTEGLGMKDHRWTNGQIDL